MKTAIALIVKFLVTMAAAWIAFMLFGTTAFWAAAIIALSGTVLNYLLGDLLVLPRLGNFAASIFDGILAGALAWAILAYSPATYNYMTTVYIFALIVAVAEFFFHMYLLSAHVVEKKKTDNELYKRNKVSYNTESGKELFPFGGKARPGNNGGRTGENGNSGLK